VELDREPTEEELAQRMGVKLSKVKELRRYGMEVTSLDLSLGGDEDGFTLGDVAASVTPMDQVEEDMSRSSLTGVLQQVLDTLPERPRTILALRYGLVDGHAYTLEEVGNRIGLTRERVRQIERKTLGLLRNGAYAQQLASFIA
jgi:RNA polymerase primary sigma factor/RNA polymerase nonessential primary-like sigma factor